MATNTVVQKKKKCSIMCLYLVYLKPSFLLVSEKFLQVASEETSHLLRNPGSGGLPLPPQQGPCIRPGACKEPGMGVGWTRVSGATVRHLHCVLVVTPAPPSMWEEGPPV